MDAIDLTQIYSNAVCDILLMVLFYIPILITLISNEYSLGDAWCTFTAYFIPMSIMVYMILTNAIGIVFRVSQLEKPAKVRSTVPISRIYWVYLACAVVASAPSIVFSALKRKEDYFMLGKVSCSFRPKQNDNVLRAIWWIYTVFLIALPLAILMSANIYAGHVISKVLENSRTVTNEQKCRVSLTISTFCWSYLLSYLPIIVFHIMVLSVWGDIDDWMKLTWSIIPVYFLCITSVTTPFILFISNVKFREYVNGLLRCGERENNPSRCITTNATE